MTENEAKQKLENLHYKIIHTSFCNKVYEIEIVALCMAKDALEKIQQYRAIGTVEELKALKDKHIGKDNMVISSSDLMTILNSDSEELKQYKEVGTVEEFKALKEKATPKKGIPYTSSNNHKFVECPSCHKDMDLYYDFCQYCGQSVDWGKSKT